MLNNSKILEFFRNPKIHKILMILVFFIFIEFTIQNIIIHVPWRDEATAWNVAKWLSFSEIIKNMKYQGHMFLWYMILKPFAVNNFYYPYSMLIINWIFVLIAIILMWKYSKFNLILKTFITFSYPIFQCYSIVAREYGMGIMLLFILAALFKKRLEHPYIYTSIIFFAANIGPIVLAGVSSFGLIFLYDLIRDSFKNKTYKRIIFPYVMFLFTSLMIWIQLGHPVIPDYSYIFNPISSINYFLFSLYKFKIFKFLSYFVIPVVVLSGISTFIKRPRALIFFILSLVQLAIIFNIYDSSDFHKYYIYIYLLISYWIYKEEEENYIFFSHKIFCIFLSILSFMYIFRFPQVPELFNSNVDNIVYIIRKSIPDIDNGVKIYSTNIFDVQEIAPYLDKTDFRYYDGGKMFTPKNFEPCWFPMLESYNFDDYYDKLDSGYVIIRHNIEYVKFLKMKKILFQKLYEEKDLYIAKLIKK